RRSSDLLTEAGDQCLLPLSGGQLVDGVVDFGDIGEGYHHTADAVRTGPVERDAPEINVLAFIGYLGFAALQRFHDSAAIVDQVPIAGVAGQIGQGAPNIAVHPTNMFVSGGGEGGTDELGIHE